MRNRIAKYAALGIALLVVLGLFVAMGCSETVVDVTELNTITPGDSTLPDGFVALDRPPNSGLSFNIPCPLGVIPESTHSPGITLGCATADGDDCIPAIDYPVFGSISAVEGSMIETERVSVVEIGGLVRGFPIRILIYHEVVNLCWDLPDGGQKFSVLTYCPIVDVAMHYVTDFACDDSPISTNRFGVSGLIYNGNLIIKRRVKKLTVDDLFVQMYGGGLNENCLEVEPVISDISWSMFKRLYPNGQVLTEETGFSPPGGYDLVDHPYREFWLSRDMCVNGLCFPLTHTDDRLRNKTLVFGVYTPHGTKAYEYFPKGASFGVINDDIGGTRIVVWNEKRFGAAAAFEARVDGQDLTFSFIGHERQGLPLYGDEETGSTWTFDGIAVAGPLKSKRLPRVPGHRAFWFAWVVFFPGTSLHDFSTGDAAAAAAPGHDEMAGSTPLEMGRVGDK